MTVLYSENNAWSIIFQIHGSIWSAVLPYCIANCILACLVIALKNQGVYIAFSAQGHGLVGLLVSFLVLNKLQYALDRYNQIRSYIGQAFLSLRELHQLVLTFNTSAIESLTTTTTIDSKNEMDFLKQWRHEIRVKILAVLSNTVTVLQNDKMACYLARNEFSSEVTTRKSNSEFDPMCYTQQLRQTLYNSNTKFIQGNIQFRLELLERTKLLDSLMVYCACYRELLRLVSTPIPFPMIQMGRTFLFLWIYTMPIALVGLDFHISAVLAFIFFLSYGYIGVELVAMQLIHPFGANGNDLLNIEGIQEAIEIGIDKDATMFDNSMVLDNNSSKRNDDHTNRIMVGTQHSSINDTQTLLSPELQHNYHEHNNLKLSTADESTMNYIPLGEALQEKDCYHRLHNDEQHSQYVPGNII